MISRVTYQGDLRTEAVHIQSGNVIVTDAPIDNNGKGDAFAPSDLVATSVASCMLTIMGIVAKRDNINIDGTTAEVEKTMSSSPRMIESITIKLFFKSKLSDKEKKKLERAANTCPVEASLNEKIKKKVEFFFHN
tara:strand:+ start:345 stop:749 length:405 start_codon:yes stop_codon:yes gene_type:complete